MILYPKTLAYVINCISCEQKSLDPHLSGSQVIGIISWLVLELIWTDLASCLLSMK